MRILTVSQPWAWAIIHGGKDVENHGRNVAGTWRGAIAIHAGTREDTSARSHPEIQRLARDVWWTSPADLLNGRFDQFGHILGVVDLVDVHHWSDCLDEVFGCSPWAMSDAYHLVLPNPRPLREPIPYRGALGPRRLDADTTQQILDAIA